MFGPSRWTATRFMREASNVIGVFDVPIWPCPIPSPAPLSTGTQGQLTTSMRYSAGNNVLLWSGGDLSLGLETNSWSFRPVRHILGIAGRAALCSGRAYPNPFRPGLNAPVMTFVDFPPNAAVTLFTVAGQRVRQMTATDSGTVSWDGTNDDGERVASGVYFAVSSSSEGTQTLKLAIQR